jgi:hypothetical protein
LGKPNPSAVKNTRKQSTSAVKSVLVLIYLKKWPDGVQIGLAAFKKINTLSD